MTDDGHTTKHRMVRIEEKDAPRVTRTLGALMISAAGEMGGAERSLLEVMRALPAGRVQASLCAPPDTELLRRGTLSQIPVYPVALRRFRRTTNPFLLAGQVRALYQASRSIRALCEERKFDVLHANTDTAALAAWEVSRLTKIPFVWHCRDMRPMHGFARPLSAAAAAGVAISGAVEQHLRREGVRPEKIRRIENGIDLSRFYKPEARAAARARARASLEIPADAPVLLCVGAYVPWKKHELFLKSLAALRSRQPYAVGLLAGSDSGAQNSAYGELLENTVRELGLTDNILRVLHERDDIPELMAAADILVSCSENEPFGRVLAEAGAAGLPVVSTRSGAKSDIVEDGQTGFLAEQGNVDALAAACLTLLNDAALRGEMGRQARARAERRYDVRRTAEELTALFETIARVQ